MIDGLMSREFAVGGVLLSSVLVSAVIALALEWAVTRVLARIGFYRFVWHRALFDAALFVILWALLISAPPFHA
jgi:hypothetical protein